MIDLHGCDQRATSKYCGIGPQLHELLVVCRLLGPSRGGHRLPVTLVPALPGDDKHRGPRLAIIRGQLLGPYTVLCDIGSVINANDLERAVILDFESVVELHLVATGVTVKMYDRCAGV